MSLSVDASPIPVYLLVALAGLLVGGVWSCYQHGQKVLGIVLAVAVILALVAAGLYATPWLS